MSNLNLKDIWIPIEILTDDKLSDKEKIIYAIMYCLFVMQKNMAIYMRRVKVA